MIFEKIGATQLDKNLQCLKIQIESKIYLIGLLDLEQALKDNRIIGVFQIAETSTQQESNAKDREK
jgi:hypothetical protein